LNNKLYRLSIVEQSVIAVVRFETICSLVARALELSVVPILGPRAVGISDMRYSNKRIYRLSSLNNIYITDMR